MSDRHPWSFFAPVTWARFSEGVQISPSHGWRQQASYLAWKLASLWSRGKHNTLRFLASDSRTPDKPRSFYVARGVVQWRLMATNTTLRHSTTTTSTERPRSSHAPTPRALRTGRPSPTMRRSGLGEEPQLPPGRLPAPGPDSGLTRWKRQGRVCITF